jgi:dCMP deaminase
VSLLGGNMYIYGTVYSEDKPINAFPCFICKKMIINAGLDRIVCSTAGGGKKAFRVSRWAQDWTKADILDDKHQYG